MIPRVLELDDIEIICHDMNERGKQIIEQLKNKDNHEKSKIVDFSAISKKQQEKIKMSFLDKKITLFLQSGQLIITELVIKNTIRIKAKEIRLKNSVVKQKFNIAKTYVATTKKNIVEKAMQFYNKIKAIVAIIKEEPIQENKIIFNISKETNLLNALSEENSNMLKEDTPISSKEENGVKVTLLNPELNFQKDACQVIEESKNHLVTVRKAEKEALKDAIVFTSNKLNNTPEDTNKIQKEMQQRYKTRAKVINRKKTTGFVSNIALIISSVLMLTASMVFLASRIIK